MTANRHLVILRDAELVAAFAATRLIDVIVEAQATRGWASVVLTGGGVGTATLQSVAAHPARDAVDWSKVDVFWGDERFVPIGDADRNDLAAWTALLDHVPIDPDRVHRVPGSDEAATPEEAAAAYAQVLATVAGRHGHDVPVPHFDVVLLGMGPEGHVASIFPDTAAVHAQSTVVAVRDCTKPPATRVSLTFPTLRSASEVWLLVTTAEKASAVAQALSGAAPEDVPAAGVHGRVRTFFLLDHAAAGQLPVELRPRVG